MTQRTDNTIQKLYRFEVDQSVRIEELNRDSVIGIASNEVSVAYVVPRKLKRHYNERFRRVGEPNKCAPTIFAASIVVSLQLCRLIPSSIVIDNEYSGYEQYIVYVVSLFFPDAIIVVERIGRKSPAHAAAYNTYLRHREPNGIITKRLLDKILKQKKTAEEPHRPGLAGVRKLKQPVFKQDSRK